MPSCRKYIALLSISLKCDCSYCRICKRSISGEVSAKTALRDVGTYVIYKVVDRRTVKIRLFGRIPQLLKLRWNLRITLVSTVRIVITDRVQSPILEASSRLSLS